MARRRARGPAGLVGELIQLAVDDRTFSVVDLAFDAVGAVVGSASFISSVVVVGSGTV